MDRPFRPRRRSGRRHPSRKASAPESSANKTFRGTTGSLAGLAAPVGPKQKGWRREWHGFALALLGVALLLSLGVNRPVLAIGLFCALSGLSLLIRPRLKKLGGWLDTCLLLVAASPLLALLPADWLPFMSWREEAVSSVSLPLGYALALSPLRLFEVWFILLAAIGWLYFVRSRPLDAKTRPILCMVIAALGAIWGAWFLLIRLMQQATHPEAGMRLLGNTDVTALMLAACGLAAYGLTLDGIRHKMASRLAAFFPLLIIAASLAVMQSAIAFIALAAGILLWTVSRLAISPDTRQLRVFLFAIASFALIGAMALQQLHDIIHGSAQLLPASEMAAFVLMESPLLGLGAGQSGQWLNLQTGYTERFDNSGFTLFNELGLLGIGLLLAIGIGFFIKLRKRGLHIESGFRLLSFLAATLCALAIIWHNGFQNPVLLFLTASLIVLSLGQGGRFQGQFFGERKVRFAGWSLLLIGCVYLFAFATALPLMHAQKLANARTEASALVNQTDATSRDRLAANLNNWIRLNPIDAVPYQLRATHLLASSRDVEAARADFARVRFLTNNDLLKLREEAETWSRQLPAQSAPAWTDYLEQARASGNDAFTEAFVALLRVIERDASLETLARQYGQEHARLRYQYIVKLQGRAFFSEIELAFADGTMAQAPQNALRSLATEAARRNAFTLAERITDKMDPDSEIGRDTRLAIQFQRGQLDKAVRSALDNFVTTTTPPLIDVADTAGQEEQLLRLARSNSPHRLEIAERLLALYMETDQITRGRQLMRQLMRDGEAPDYGVRWLAEILYRQGDHVESWEVLRYQFPYLDIFYNN